MTDEQIIKALEYCSEQGITSECEKCKFKKGCRTEMIATALDLVNRQKAEIKRLKESYAAYEETTGLKWARAEAINSYHEEVKKRCIEGGIYPAIVKKIMEDVRKEMVGE